MSVMAETTKLADRIGEELGISHWILIDQAKIDAHADLSEDRDWLHNDPERAARESPTGTTIVQGFLMLSHLVQMAESLGNIADDVHYLLNYGFDRVRIIRPVPVDSRIRGRFVLKHVKPKGDDGFVATLDVRVEIEGEDEPAIIAEWLFYARVA
jgi:acyl dehydratase